MLTEPFETHSSGDEVSTNEHAPSRSPPSAITSLDNDDQVVSNRENIHPDRNRNDRTTMYSIGQNGIEAQDARIYVEGQSRRETEDNKRCCGTSNLRALWGMLLLNTLFAISQMVGATIANSLSMFSDSASMLIDSMAYLINLWMERTKNKYGSEASKIWEAYTSVFSVVLLICVTIVAIGDAARRLTKRHVDEETVDGRLVLGFSLGNLLIDIVMCGNYCYQLRHRRKRSLKEQVMSEAKDQLNMVSAFVHLFADTLRTITGLVAGILEQGEGADAIFIDGVATFIVCGAILLAACFVLYESYQQYMEYRNARNRDIRNEAGLGDEDFRFRSTSDQSTGMHQSFEMNRT